MSVCQATGLTPRISISAPSSLRTSCRVASITTSTPSSTRLSDITPVFSPLSNVSSSPDISSSSFRIPIPASSSQFTSSALNGCCFYCLRSYFCFFDLTFILIHAQAMLAPLDLRPACSCPCFWAFATTLRCDASRLRSGFSL